MDTPGFDYIAAQLPLYRDRLLALPAPLKSQTTDIRLKSGQPVTLFGREGAVYLKESAGASRELDANLAVAAPADLQEIFLHICGHSVFSHENEIRRGYVQLAGGGRVGLCGTAVMEKGRVKGMRDISSLVFRVPRDVPRCGDRLFQAGLDPARGLLIAGEPGSGKTTLLRDIARSLSLGRLSPSRRVVVLDSRGELSSGFELGPCADVLKGFPKGYGLDMAIRSLSPEVLVCDELAPEDLGAVRQAVYAGAGLVATVHAGRENAAGRPLCRKLLETGAFAYLATLSGRACPCAVYSLEAVG